MCVCVFRYQNVTEVRVAVLTLAGGGDERITPVELLTGTLREREMGTASPGMVT